MLRQLAVKGRKLNTPVASVANRQFSLSEESKRLIQMEEQYLAPYYPPVPIVIARGQGTFAWDVDGRKYIDCLVGFAACSQGHCHPKIIKALTDQAQILTQQSRSFMNNISQVAAKTICDAVGYDMMLPQSSGVESVESAIKVARRWGYTVKGIPDKEATILMARGCFWGRSISAIGGCSDFARGRQFGPFTPGFDLVDYNDVEQIENYLRSHPNCAAVLLEPLQGEGGVRVPDDDYFAKVKALTEKYNVLLISDEIQAGLGRTGKLLCN